MILGYKFAEEEKEKRVYEICKMIRNSNPKKCMLWVDLGKLYRKLENYEDALSAFERALALDPKHKVSLNNIGYTYFLQEQYERAIRFFLKSIYIDPKFRLPINNLLKIASQYYQNKEYKKAVRLLKFILNIDDNVTEAWIDLGLSYRRLKQLDDSVYAYKRALKLDNSNELVWNNLGYAFYKMNDYHNAVDAYHQALELNPDFEFPLNNLIEISRRYYKKEKFKEAINLLKIIVQHQPDNASNWINLGLSYSKVGEFKNALRAYQYATEDKTEKENERLYNNLGYIHYQMENYKKAAEHYIKALEINPEYAITIENLSNLALELTNWEQYDQAIKIYEVLCENEKIKLEGLINLGRVYRIKENYEKSIQMYKKALTLEEKNELVWNNLGYAFDCKGEIEKAIEAYSNALEVDSAYSLSSNNLTNLSFRCIEKGVFKKARQILQMLLDKEEEGFELWDELFYMYRENNQYKLLLNTYRKYKDNISLDNSVCNDIGYSYFAMGKFMRSIDWYYQALRIEPESEISTEDLLEIANHYLSEKKIQNAEEVCNLLLDFQKNNENAQEFIERINKEKKSIS
ncbi:MAG: tetratricopeptide repeat protein [Promethearchaeia archaeon]